jgi:hypothetical protein
MYNSPHPLLRREKSGKKKTRMLPGTGGAQMEE